jgi:hypothetical protein
LRSAARLSAQRPTNKMIALCGLESKSSHIRNACPKSSPASRLTAAQVRVLDLSNPPPRPERLALGDAFEPEQATNQATVRLTAP